MQESSYLFTVDVGTLLGLREGEKRTVRNDHPTASVHCMAYLQLNFISHVISFYSISQNRIWFCSSDFIHALN